MAVSSLDPTAGLFDGLLATDPRRKLAVSMLQQGMDASPVQSWTQGLARMAQGFMGGLALRNLEDEADTGRKQGATDAAALLPGGGVTAPAAIAAPTSTATVPDDDNAVPGTVGMNQALADRTQDFIQDNPGTTMTSGVRTPDQQAALFADRANNPNPVAAPGTSLHEKGLAVDIGGMTPDQRAQLPQYGLSQPVANDPVHVQLASNDSTIPLSAGGQKVAVALGNVPPTPTAAMPDGAQKVAAAMRVLNNPYARAGDKAIAQAVITQANKVPTVQSLGDGYIYQNGKVTRAYTPEDKTPTDQLNYKFYVDNFQPTPEQPKPLPFEQFVTLKSKAGASNINVDTKAGDTYDSELVKGLAKSHAGLANGVEEAQSRARDLAAMQGAIDAIQKNNGSTGGMGQQQLLNLQKSINTGLNAIGITKPFSEADISDKEFLTKFNRTLAGAQAKNAVGSRVTNFEMNNFLKANPGLDMSITGNQRLLGIMSQVEQRNIAVGQAIRDATAEAVANGKRVNPSKVEKLVRSYDDEHHITDPITGQDLTQSYVLPEFQKGGSNPAQAEQHEQNVGKIRRWNPATGKLE